MSRLASTASGRRYAQGVSGDFIDGDEGKGATVQQAIAEHGGCGSGCD
ncbi:MAG: hypothetical protein HY078_08435 [Elusimicrobia bacterium]|nr:hypothetical protein [Elusimicrobiota bacterium]